jgi:hypothetical protein
MPDVIFRNVGAIGATQLAERCLIILLTSTKWSVFNDDTHKPLLSEGLRSEATEGQ